MNQQLVTQQNNSVNIFFRRPAGTSRRRVCGPLSQKGKVSELVPKPSRVMLVLSSLTGVWPWSNGNVDGNGKSNGNGDNDDGNVYKIMKMVKKKKNILTTEVFLYACENDEES